MAEMACPCCGANVLLAENIDTGEKVPLEVYTDAAADADRFRIVSTGPPWKAQRVPTNAVGDFYPDHRFDCKDFNAGRTF